LKPVIKTDTRSLLWMSWNYDNQ